MSADEPILACEYVTIEAEVGGQWKLVGSVADIEPPASFRAENGVVYIAGWIGDDGPALWQSPGRPGTGNSTVWEISTIGLQRLADLRDGTVTMLMTREGGPLLRTRFRLGRQE